MNILTIHFNTPELTEALVRSINKHTQGCKVYVFDNSDKRPFTAMYPNVEVIDNTKGQVIDFDKMLDEYLYKVGTVNKWGSAKHCKSVDVCMDIIPEGFILIDSDMLVFNDLSPWWDERYAYSGEVRVTKKHPVKIPRLWPFLCYINAPMCREHGVRYFNGEYMWKLVAESPNQWYDTGAWFLEDCKRKGLVGKEMRRSDYAIHFGGGSWMGKNNGGIWLEEHKELWR